MIEVNDRRVEALGEGSVLAGPGGGGDGRESVEGSGSLAEAAVLDRAAAIPDPEVSVRPKRRRFSAAYKARRFVKYV